VPAGAIAAVIALGTGTVGCRSVPEPRIPEGEPPAHELGPREAPRPQGKAPAGPASPAAKTPPEVAPTRAFAGHPVELHSEAPAGIQSARHMPFGGSEAFLVRGDWYVETPAGWARFTKEPSELRACRLALRRRDSPATRSALGSPLPAPPGCPVR
jgi:hypothetical protein